MTPLKPPFALSPSHPFALSLSKGPRPPSRHSCEGRNPEVRGRGASPVPVRPDATRSPPLTPSKAAAATVIALAKIPFALSLSKGPPLQAVPS